MTTYKSEGTTPSERFLSTICERTFLSLWSYPNLFRDQGRTTENADGKELCDLLVVFGDDVLIFSDKSCVMGDTGDVALDWSRWFKKAVSAAADQIYGAERWLREHPGRVYVDRRCTIPLPFNFPTVEGCRFHRIVIATGARERCARELGTTGSLQIIPYIVDGAHAAKFDRAGKVIEATGFGPFAVGRVNSSKGFVHVYDAESLELLMGELDTARDLIDYLRAKEDLIVAGGLAYATGEEELLYEYLRTFDPKRGHSFDPPAGSALTLASGGWERWQRSVRYAANREQYRESRLWDDLINRFSVDSLAGKALPGSTENMSEVERVLRVMAGESRLARQGLSIGFLDRWRDSATAEWFLYRMAFSMENPATGYAFLYYRRADGADFPTYRAERRSFLVALTMLYGAKNRHLKQIVGIATEAGSSTAAGQSFEVVFSKPRDGGDWPSDAEIRDVQEVFGLRDEAVNAGAFVGTKHLPS